MVFRTNDTAKSEEWFCPIYNSKIDCGLCFEVSNIGDDTLCLKGDDKPLAIGQKPIKPALIVPVMPTGTDQT